METFGVRLDSVICSEDSLLVYRYVQRVKSRKDLRRIDLVMDGCVFREDKAVYQLPQVGPLTYYISSMTFFADRSLRYIRKIIARNAVVNTAAYIDFKVGDASLCDTLHNNGEELSRIKNNVATLFADTSYTVDSIVITSSCSPEGRYQFNEKLSKRRGAALQKYFFDYTDSLNSSIWNINLSDTESVGNIPVPAEVIKTRSVAENWEQLGRILHSDTTLLDRAAIEKAMQVPGLDERERALSKTKDYPYIRSVVYPLLRTVKFDFHLHRKGMIKDTVHTTEVDAVYMEGVDFLMERDYEKAIALLRPYNDINTAIAYLCLDYNNSALQVLEGLPKTPHRDYMLAVVWARLGDERSAVEYFVHAVEKDPSMRHRGNLDPEISALIRKYFNQL
jgi:tetratricopeptide (TPR) repeat protein